MRTLLTAMLLLVAGLTLADDAQDYEQVMQRLDESLSRRTEFEQKKEERIDRLRQQFLTATSPADRFGLALRLNDEYKSYKYDSAHYYAIQCLQMAQTASRPDDEVRAKCAVTFCLLSSGLYKEAYDMFQSISSLAGTTDESQRTYFAMGSRLYFDMADYNHDPLYQDDYVRQGCAYTDSLLSRLDSTTALFLYYEGMMQMKDRRYDECAATFRQLLSRPDTDERTRAIVSSCLGWMSFFKGDREAAKRYLAESAIIDNESATKETTALTNLAQMCYQDGDIDRATHYVQMSLDDANFYNARQRLIEIGSILPIIEQDRFNIAKSRQDTMRMALVAAVLALVILLGGIIFIRRQMKKLQAARRVIEERNQVLQQTNDRLQEANKIKNEYIGKSFYINSEYIAKVEKLYRLVDRKIVAHQYDDLRATLKESTLEAERKNMCAGFDETFLKLFPHFVEKFNELFEEKDRRLPDEENTLTGEMRIFALIRLGVSDSERIANFLDYSVHTVNTYKTRVKNRSIVDNDLFEQRIMEIV